MNIEQVSELEIDIFRVGPQGDVGPQGPQGEPGPSYDDTDLCLLINEKASITYVDNAINNAVYLINEKASITYVDNAINNAVYNALESEY